MAILRIDHLGVAVKEIEKAKEVFQNLGMEVEGEGKFGEMNYVILKCGESKLELLSPASEEEKVISKFLEKKGEGLHHVCFATDSIAKTLERVEELGCKPVGEVRKGLEGKNVIFLYPKTTNGVLVELLEDEE